MAAPRVTIDQLPEKTVPAPTDLLVIQDAAVTKKMTMANVIAANGVAAHIGNPTGAHAATAISAASNGPGFDGTNVQVQLGQLASSVNTLTSSDSADVAALAAHLADAVDAHDASAVSVVPASGITATDAQAAFVQVVSRQINTIAPLTGGGDLTANRSLGVNDFTTSTRGTVPASGGGTANFLRADGAWLPPPGTAGAVVPPTRLINTSAPLTGGGDLSADRTLSISATAFAPTRRPLNNQTGTTYAPVLGDENTMVTLSNAAAITVTLPSNTTVAFPIGAEVDFLWLGVGKPTFAAGSGATVNATPGLGLRAQYSAATAKKITTNGWVVIGDLA